MSMAVLEMAKDKIHKGAERNSLALATEEKRLTAYHESGHIIISRVLPENDPVLRNFASTNRQPEERRPWTIQRSG